MQLLLVFNMKVFIAFVIFAIAAVFGQENEISDSEKRVTEMLKAASRACGQEMNIDPHYINNDGYTSHPNINVEACLKACVDKKMGVVNEDGSYNLDRILSYTESPRIRQIIADNFTDRMKHCSSLVDKSPCKLSACIHGMPECAYTGAECIPY